MHAIVHAISPVIKSCSVISIFYVYSLFLFDGFLATLKVGILPVRLQLATRQLLTKESIEGLPCSDIPAVMIEDQRYRCNPEIVLDLLSEFYTTSMFDSGSTLSLQ